MADKLMRCIVTIPRSTGLPEDVFQNTLYFDGDDNVSATDADYHETVEAMVTTFYDAFDGGFSDLCGSTATGRIYDMRDPEPRVPEYTWDFPLDIVAGSATLPAEVALVLSFQAALVSGESRARRRGRIYLPPFGTAQTVESGGDVRPVQGLIDTITDAAAVMAAGADLPDPLSGSVRWAVYSPTIDATGTIEQAFNDVTNGWMDNAFDTQRRRGAAATSRTLWSA